MLLGVLLSSILRHGQGDPTRSGPSVSGPDSPLRLLLLLYNFLVAPKYDEVYIKVLLLRDYVSEWVLRAYHMHKCSLVAAPHGVVTTKNP